MTEQLEGQVSMLDLDSAFGKMFREPCPQTTEKTSESSLKSSARSQPQALLFLDLRKENGNPLGASWETVTALHGESWTPVTTECPNDAVEYRLSQILQEDAPHRFYLTSKACAGILRRAKKRGKELPAMLREALEEAVAIGDANA